MFFLLFGQIFLLLIAIFINTISYLIFDEERSFKIYKFLTKLTVESKILNMNVKFIGNTKLFEKKGSIFIANHQNATDFCLISNQIYKPNGICKAELFQLNDMPFYYRILKIFEKNLIKSYRFIPYERGNKDSGEKVKNIIIDTVNRGENIIVFPDGETRRDGIPKQFKSGLFRTAADNNISIIPLTIKYSKPIGVNREDIINPIKWFNNSATIYIHPEQKSDKWEELKDNCFNLIKEPMISKKID